MQNMQTLVRVAIFNFAQKKQRYEGQIYCRNVCLGVSCSTLKYIITKD